MPVSELPHAAQRGALRLEDRVHAFAQAHAVTILRTSLGLVFVLFGALKFFPDLSPAQAVAEATTTKLTFGLIPAQGLLLVVAVVEVTVGLLLVANRFMRFALWLLAFEMLAILSPLVLLTGQLFSGPHHLPGLLGQYILKDFVLLGAVLVLFALQRAPLGATAPAAATSTARRASVAGGARTLYGRSGVESHSR